MSVNVLGEYAKSIQPYTVNTPMVKLRLSRRIFALNQKHFRSDITFLRQNLMMHGTTVISIFWKVLDVHNCKFNLCIPRNETGRPRFQFLHSCIFERFIYFQDRSAYLAAATQADRSWEYINRSQIHECGNWETEHYNSVLEITRPCSLISWNT